MKKYKVVFAPKAHIQMEQLGEYIAAKSGAKIALDYIARIESHCKSLKIFPHRGRKRDDLHPGLRIIGHGRRVNIAFSVYMDKVIVHGIFHGGQDIDSRLASMDS